MPVRCLESVFPSGRRGSWSPPAGSARRRRRHCVALRLVAGVEAVRDQVENTRVISCGIQIISPAAGSSLLQRDVEALAFRRGAVIGQRSGFPRRWH